MRLGICANIDKAGACAAAGADYIELSCSEMLAPDDDDAAWAPKMASIKAMPLPVEVFNIFLSKGKMVGPEADAARLQRYTQRAAERAATVGAQIIVIGSGRARNVPDGMLPQQALVQFKRFLSYCHDAGTRYGITFCIEPLNHTESNFINSLSSGAELVRSAASPRVALLADTYHMAHEREDLREIYSHAAIIKHVHTADIGRAAPGESYYDHAALFRVLHDGAYTGRVSIECHWNDFDAEAARAIQHLRAKAASR